MRFPLRVFAFVAAAMSMAFLALLIRPAVAQEVAGMSHCVSSGVTCATCTTGAMIIFCSSPIPMGYSIGDCQQGGNHCSFFANFSCGTSSYCSTNLPTGNNCLQGYTVCQ
jgi:hypothetical protein